MSAGFRWAILAAVFATTAAAPGVTPTSSASPEEFAKLIKDDYAAIGKVVKAAGIKAK